MSRENVEIVRRVYTLLNEGSEAVRDELPSEFVLDFSRRLMDPLVLRGRDQVLAFVEREVQMWEGDHVGYEPKELLDADDKVLALVRVSGRGRASGVEVEAYTWNVATFRDGKLVELTYFGDDRAAAPRSRRAVGVGQQTALPRWRRPRNSTAGRGLFGSSAPAGAR